MTITPTTTVVPLTASTHFPIKLTASNFPVWKCQVHSALVGLGLEGYVDGTLSVPDLFTDEAKTITNPCYVIWYRQDRTILSALLGSCSDSVQPLISSASTARSAWDKLTFTYASTSRGRIISLKTMLARTTKGNRPVTEYLSEMYGIFEALALAQNPIPEEDLVISILNGLGPEYSEIRSAIRVRAAALPVTELQDILLEHETNLHNTQHASDPLVPTANPIQMSAPGATINYTTGDRRPMHDRRHHPPRRGRGGHYSGASRSPSQTPICRYCSNPGHVVKECRKLQRFLKENQVTCPSSQAQPMVHTTSAHTPPGGQHWLFDSGASHHVTNDVASLPTYTDYGGPDEVRLGDGSGHGGVPHARGELP
ncbi:unnamed protein product [Cuscuta epithymum]|uniref:CCHC-type domain-containing protein n=1 Tax=Cuscuta epithymum TaxID=186058 RepID=A0AAV0EXJ3_9ASTE|nr:unnamed protein product [Cuscuta epithymum]